MAVFLNIKKEDKKLLIDKLKLGIEETKTKYELFRLRNKDVVMVLFTSGKLLVQGRDVDVADYSKMLKSLGYEEQKKVDFVKQDGVFIGSDEALKGDTFGGLIVAGVIADGITRENLRLLGVMDSKKLKDDKIASFADDVKRIAMFSVKSYFPKDYNEYKSGLTKLLNKLHKEVHDDLKIKDAKWVVDKYPGCNVGDIAVTKAESKYIEVAAASIIARDEALKQLRELSKRLCHDVPKGSTNVKDALEFLKKSGKEPKLFVKMNFGNVMKVVWVRKKKIKRLSSYNV